MRVTEGALESGFESISSAPIKKLMETVPSKE